MFIIASTNKKMYSFVDGEFIDIFVCKPLNLNKPFDADEFLRWYNNKYFMLLTDELNILSYIRQIAIDAKCK